MLSSDLKTLEEYTIFGSENLGGVYYFRTHYPRRRFGGVWGGEAPPARRGVWGAAGTRMISAVSARLEFTSLLNCLTSALQFKFGLPGYANIFASRLRFKLGLLVYVFQLTSRLLCIGQHLTQQHLILSCLTTLVIFIDLYSMGRTIGSLRHPKPTAFWRGSAPQPPVGNFSEHEPCET